MVDLVTPSLSAPFVQGGAPMSQYAYSLWVSFGEGVRFVEQAAEAAKGDAATAQTAAVSAEASAAAAQGTADTGVANAGTAQADITAHKAVTAGDSQLGHVLKATALLATLPADLGAAGAAYSQAEADEVRAAVNELKAAFVELAGNLQASGVLA